MSAERWKEARPIRREVTRPPYLLEAATTHPSSFPAASAPTPRRPPPGVGVRDQLFFRGRVPDSNSNSLLLEPLFIKQGSEVKNSLQQTLNSDPYSTGAPKSPHPVPSPAGGWGGPYSVVWQFSLCTTERSARVAPSPPICRPSKLPFATASSSLLHREGLWKPAAIAIPRELRQIPEIQQPPRGIPSCRAT
jgi:hypothetical protein